MMRCPDCDGKGEYTSVDGTIIVGCFLCDADGKVAAPRCPHCDGIGFVRPPPPGLWPKCEHCDGSGEVTP